MDIINNRYRVLREIDSITFAVRDGEDHARRIIRVIEGDAVDENLRDFFAARYDIYTNIAAPEIVKSLDFGVIRHIDGAKNENLQYYMLSEYTKDVPVSSGINAVGNTAALKMFTDACRGACYLHLKNITHGDICPETLHIEENGGASVLRYRSLAAVELWRRGRNTNLFFKAPETAFEGSVTPAADIYSLGVLLFKLTCESDAAGDFAAAYASYKASKGDKFTRRLFPIIDKMTAPVEERYTSLIDVVNDVNAAFKTNYPPFDKAVVGQINHTVGLVGCGSEKAAITEAVDNPAIRCVCVHGGFGVGLTACLRDLTRKWRLQGRVVYSALGTPDESLSVMLKQLMADRDPKSADKAVMRQVHALINGANPEGFSPNLVLKFIYDCVKDVPAAFVLDAAHLARAENFELISKLMDVCKKITLVLAYRTDFENPELSAFLASLPENHCKVLIPPLNEDETVTLLQRKLSLRDAPVAFGKELYAATQGNPLFICEILKSVQANGTLDITERGQWHINYDKSSGAARLPMPSTIRQISMEQAARLDAAPSGVKPRKLLEAISVFNTPVSLNEAAECSGLTHEEAVRAADECETMGYLHRSHYRENHYLFFDFKMLREYLYEALGPAEQTRLHRLAAQTLEKREDGAYLADIVYHLEKAGEFDARLAGYLTEIGKRLAVVGVAQKAAETFEKALAIPGCDRVEILLSLGRVYMDSGDREKGGECLAEAARMVRGNEDPVYKAKALCRAVGALPWVLPALMQIFDDNPTLKDELAAEYFGALDAEARAETDTARKIEMARDAYMQCPEDLYDIRAGLLLGWGHAEYISGDALEAARVWEAARPFMDSLTNMRYLTSLLNNLSNVAQTRDDFDASKQIILEGVDLCKQHGLLRNQGYLLISLLDCYFKCAELEKTLPLAREIVELERIQGQTFDWLLFRALLYADRYTEAHAYALEMEEVRIGYYDGTGEFDPVANAEYLSGRARFALYMGEDAEARVFLDAEKAESERGVMGDYAAQKYRPFLNAVRAMKAGDAECVLHAYNDFLMYTGAFWQRQEILFHLAELLIFLHDGGGLSLLGAKTGEAMERLEHGAAAMAVKGRYHYLLALTREDEDQRLYNLREARRLAKACGQPLLLAKCLLALGAYYTDKSRYHSYYFYAEADRTISCLLENVPPKFHQGFVARHKLVAPELTADAGLWASAHEAFFARLPEGIRTPEDVLSAVGSDAEENLSLVARFLAAVAHAERAELIMESEDGFEVIASDDGEKGLTAGALLLRRVQALELPYINAGNGEAVICVAAVLDDTVLGYIYLYAGHGFHKFNDESLHICKRLAPLVAFNINQIKVKDGAFTDRLTGALNAKAFDMGFERVLARAREYGRDFSVILCDLDRFKSVNDTFGHQTGDELLRAVGRIFRANVPAGAVFGRVGGDEFAFVLDGLGMTEALAAADVLRRAVAGAMLLGAKRPVTVSMGLSAYGRDGETKNELMEKADMALYVCKERGRNGCVPYAPDYGGKTHYVNFMDGIITSDALRDGERMRFVLSLLELLRAKMPAEEKKRQMLNGIAEIMHGTLEGEGECLSAPVTRGGEAVGALRVYALPGRKAFSRDDEKYLQYLSGFLAAVN